MDSILGYVLEYHFLRQHATFRTNPVFTEDIRNVIEQNLQSWNSSLQQQLHGFLRSGNPSKEIGAYEPCDQELYIPQKSLYPKVVLYGKHLYHCMHILLYGTMDFIQMCNDPQWQSSSDFLKAGEHANSCAKVCFKIVLILILC
jgi:hypothetical protein